MHGQLRLKIEERHRPTLICVPAYRDAMKPGSVVDSTSGERRDNNPGIQNAQKLAAAAYQWDMRASDNKEEEQRMAQTMRRHLRG
jgi:hypothetical protein